MCHRRVAVLPVPGSRRILKYSGCSSECFLLSLVYIDRLIQRTSILLTSLNIHRIIITRSVAPLPTCCWRYRCCWAPPVMDWVVCCIFVAFRSTSVMLAAKFFDDQYFNNAFYAKVRQHGVTQRGVATRVQ